MIIQGHLKWLIDSVNSGVKSASNPVVDNEEINY